ncbi:hypothetical protein WMY93_002471 [Mugilogobius chulae]|uniref:Medium-chain acyl-CoA ligase ACSF2, mitochondrial n=1 Tax=Mugilogobius chulae TaxID=88201 RepID=A0AAW0PUG7_9GOBI
MSWTNCSPHQQQHRSLHVDSPPQQPSLRSSYVHGTSSVSLLPSTVSQTLDSAAQRWPEREALVFVEDGIRKTFAQFHQDVNRLAAGLLALGLKPGDRVGVWGPNSYEWILSQFATAKAGMILVSLNQAYVAKGLEFTLRKVQCKAVICPSSFKTQKFCEILRNLCPEINTSLKGHIQSSRLPDLRMVIVMDSVEPGMLHFQDVMKAGESRHHKELMDLQSKLTFDDPLTYSLLRCNFVYGTPTMYTDMLNRTDLHTFDWSSIEGGVVGGAPCPPEILRRLKNEMNIKEIMSSYGTTENSPVTFLGFPLDSDELKLNTVGCIMPHTEATVVDPVTGVTVPLGASGELLIRGYCVMLGYWEDEAKTKEAIGKDRWYRTGNIASLNSRGYCVIEGRIKDLIIRGGENIYPAEIEQFLFTHPKVKEVQVVGVRDERLGEQVCACITLRDGQSCTPEEIQGYCKGQISYFKIPHYVMFVDSFPLTASGKIKKIELKGMIEKKLGLRSLHVDSPPQQPSLRSSYVHGTSSVSLLPLTVSQTLDSAHSAGLKEKLWSLWKMGFGKPLHSFTKM